MTTLNKIIDAAVVHRIGDLVIVPENHLLPPGSDRKWKLQVGVVEGSSTHSGLGRQDSRTGSVLSGDGGSSSTVGTPDSIPGRGIVGHYGQWMLMWRQHATKDATDADKEQNVTIIGMYGSGQCAVRWRCG
nr:uncharacterized protein LOC128698671 [Cherax quadricarinatus]